MNPATAVSGLLIGALLIGCAGDGPGLSSPTPGATEPALQLPSPVPVGELGAGDPTGMASVDGITVEIWLDRSQAAYGDVVHALVRLTNEGERAVSRETNTCGVGPAPAVVEADSAVGSGIAWDGIAAAFKADVLAGAGLLDGGRSLIGRFGEARMMAPAPGGAAWGCAAFSAVRPFRPGDSDEMLLGWIVRPAEGMAFAPGPAVVRATFTETSWEDELADPLTLTAEAAIELVAAAGEVPAVGLTLVDYVDAALANPEFAAWLEAEPEASWINTHVIYWPTDAGTYPEMPPYDRLDGRPVVSIGLFRMGNGQRMEAFGAAIVDRETGQVVALESQ